MKFLPISENKKFKYSIYFQSFDEESLEMGSSIDSGYEKIETIDSIGDILRLANSTYGIYYPVSFGVWESTEPLQNTEYFEKGISKYFSLHISNEDGTPISTEENDFITFLLSDGRYNSNVFEEYAVGGIVLGTIAVGIGALITYFYFKNKKGSDSKNSTNPRAKSVVRNINGKDRRFPIKDAWRNEHDIENKREKYEVPQAQRTNKFEMGGDASEHYHEIEYGNGGVAKAKDIIMNKIGFNQNIADYLVSQSEKFSIWLADSILKDAIKRTNTSKTSVLETLNDRSLSVVTNVYSANIREILDWLQHPLTPKQNLRELSFMQALEKAREWHEELEVIGGDIDFIEPENNFILKKYPKNKEGIEYYWVYIPSNFCSLESSRMGHCGRTGYNNQLISLRSIRPYGKGHTINDSHVTIAYGKEDGLFKQVKGKKNNKPSEKYFPFIFDLIKSASQGGGIEYVKEGMKFDENNKLTVQKEILQFNGFGSEYYGDNDYDFEDMTDEELRELFKINRSLFRDSKTILLLYDKNIISKKELQDKVIMYGLDTYSMQLELFNRGIITEKPNTKFQLNYSCGEVDRLLDTGGNRNLVEVLLCGDFDDDIYDNFSYYYENPSDSVDNLNDLNSKRIIDEIVRITNYDESEVIENGIKYYLDGEDENFTKDDFDGIIRALANAQNYADRDDYYLYAKKELINSIEELGKIEYLDDRGLSIEIDLLDFQTEKEIAEKMDYWEFESISDLFEELVSADAINLPRFEIDDRYSPYGDTKVFNDYFSDSDLETYNKGGKLKTKNTIKNNKIKTMNSLDSEFKGGGNVGAISKTKIVITENKEENKIQATRTLVKENSKGEKITYELLVGKHTDKASKPNRYADGWFEIYATDEDDNEYFYSEGGLWLQGNKVVDYDGVGALSEKLRPLMSALNMNSSEVFSQGGAVKSKRRKKRQPKVTRIQFEEGNYEYEGGGGVDKPINQKKYRDYRYSKGYSRGWEYINNVKPSKKYIIDLILDDNDEKRQLYYETNDSTEILKYVEKLKKEAKNLQPSFEYIEVRDAIEGDFRTILSVDYDNGKWSEIDIYRTMNSLLLQDTLITYGFEPQKAKIDDYDVDFYEDIKEFKFYHKKGWIGYVIDDTAIVHSVNYEDELETENPQVLEDFLSNLFTKKYEDGGEADDDYNDDDDEDDYAGGGEVLEWMEEALESLIEETGNDDLEITYVSNDGTEFYATNGDVEYRVFKTEDDAERVAVEQVREDMEETPENFNQDFIAGYVDGREFFTEALNEMNYSYANDIQTEADDRYENRLIAEMVENGLMDEEDAESGNADELADYYKDDYVSLLTEGQLNEGANGLQHFIDNFGEEEAMRMVIENNLIDIESASTDAVGVDGIAHFLSSYDGETLYLSNNYVAYRIN